MARTGTLAECRPFGRPRVLPDYAATFGAIRKTMHALLDARKPVVMLGGDHCAPAAVLRRFI